MHPHQWLVAILSICAAAGSYASPPQTTTTPKRESTTSESPMQLVARYRGVLPCADCPGIDTILSLFAKSPNDLAHTRYVLQRTYQERSNTLTETGAWTIVRGTPDNPLAAVYQLQPKDGSQPTNFLKISDDEILQLDSERRRIDSKLNFSLRKTTSKSSPTQSPDVL